MDHRGEAAGRRLEETRALVFRAKEGCGEAFDELFARYYERIRTVVRLRMGPELRRSMESDDILQSAFGEAFRELREFRYRSEGAFLHWLVTMVTNIIRDHGRRLKAVKRRAPGPPLQGTRAEQALEGVAAGEPTPCESASRREAEERLFRALELMEEAPRNVLCLHRFEGLSRPEMAEILGCSVDAVRMRILRAERALMEAYVRLDGESP